MRTLLIVLCAVSFIVTMNGCASPKQKSVAKKSPITLITMDPGHFHAALVQKNMIPGIDSNVYVYAPEGNELKAHLSLIKQYNNRSETPTRWNEIVYTGKDFAERMLQEKKGNVVVFSGNNRLKAQYIRQAVNSGLNVMADKPMIINSSDFDLLLQSFSDAKKKNVLLYDIMTERSEITNILQKEFSQDKEIFGELKNGTPSQPSVVFESDHYFFKQVSGKDLIQPIWFFDPEQQGEAIADVGTHLVDLVQWECFPDIPIDYNTDVRILSAKLWPTPLTLSQFTAVTKSDSFPAFLTKYVKNNMLQTHANGEINYTINGKHIKVAAKWKYQAEEGGDTYIAKLNGTKATLEVQQGKQEKFQPTLYIFPEKGIDKKQFDSVMAKGLARIAAKYPGVNSEAYKNGYKIIIPQRYKVGHEAHFSQVMERYLDYLQNKNMPEWEIPNMITKYFITTKGVEMASKLSKKVSRRMAL